MFYAHLDYFQPNPWQPRQTLDETALRELAENIHTLYLTRPDTHGLLQLPAARLVSLEGDPLDPALVFHTWYPDDNPNGHRNLEGDDLSDWLITCGYGGLQLAWGHRRLEAMRLLATLHPDRPEYLRLPFELAHFTNEEMFQIALSENVARADLNPIEIATAMQRYRDEFGKSSKEIGTLFGLSDSAVRNLLRLLDLPDEPRQALAEGKMSQGAARMLLTLYSLPEALRTQAEKHWSRETKPSQIIEDAIQNGALASNIDHRIATLIKDNCEDLSASSWKWDDILEDEIFKASIVHPTCKTCPLHLTRGNRHYCADKTCFSVKRRLNEKRYLQAASETSGYPIYEGPHTFYELAQFDYSRQHPALEFARTNRCPNLCLRYREDRHRDPAAPNILSAQGFPNVELLCGKLERYCTCKKAVEAGLQITPTQTANLEIGEDNRLHIELPPAWDEPTSPALTEKDLKNLNRQINAQKADNREQSKHIRAQVEQRLLSTLNLFNLKAWKLIAKKLRYDCGRDAKTWDDLTAALASQLTADAFDYYNLDELDRHLNKANTLLDELGLPPLDHLSTPSPVSIETVSTETPPDDGLLLETCLHEWTADDHDNITCAHCAATFDDVVSNNP